MDAGLNVRRREGLLPSYEQGLAGEYERIKVKKFMSGLPIR